MSTWADKSWSHFDRTSFEEVHAGVLDFLPSLPARILDVGAGTGRDARALSRLGYEVTAVEPSPLLYQEASSREGPHVEWRQDELPQLKQLEHRRFDFVLVSAVWMYVEPLSRPAAMKRLYRLLDDNSVLVLTTRPELRTDDPRAFWEASDSEVMRTAKAAGLIPVRERSDVDSLGRGIVWKTFVFRQGR
ncbi:class I SAM-dependent methyltransferase [Mesorhizobium mediterraneum]|uniref:class I SAM-dependent methyltransferase n=1 Tax=Mesorhizobium mediterraneum TaxID=43617 RepID=UPI0017807FA0|nr:class I SAM-dependent methyltransferase [Mesorhizobium mediterraneum]